MSSLIFRISLFARILLKINGLNVQDLSISSTIENDRPCRNMDLIRYRFHYLTVTERSLHSTEDFRVIMYAFYSVLEKAKFPVVMLVDRSEKEEFFFIGDAY